ncbi:SLP adapter and CSK-interacting membrane protein isoform X1 [Oryctolagus cuniculus]|uniref:SLP adapter and CSK-interacting membrane protein isoform X1 n=2 Tax=Oryctolagus cuniculus TaxID=9986 RepID=UPI00387965B4
MSWWRDNFWIILAVAMIIVSVSLGLIMYCIYRCQLRQGKKWEVVRPLKQNRRDEEKTYENVFNQSPTELPPLPPRGLPSLGDSSPQETPSLQPPTYSLVNMRNKTATSSYMEPESDYDDIEIPANTEGHHLKTTFPSNWEAKQGSHGLF